MKYCLITLIYLVAYILPCQIMAEVDKIGPFDVSIQVNPLAIPNKGPLLQLTPTDSLTDIFNQCTVLLEPHMEKLKTIDVNLEGSNGGWLKGFRIYNLDDSCRNITSTAVRIANKLELHISQKQYVLLIQTDKESHFSEGDTKEELLENCIINSDFKKPTYRVTSKLNLDKINRTRIIFKKYYKLSSEKFNKHICSKAIGITEIN